jgi:hypothetical protein
MVPLWCGSAELGIRLKTAGQLTPITALSVLIIPFDADQKTHSVALDPSCTRIVLNSGETGPISGVSS